MSALFPELQKAASIQLNELEQSLLQQVYSGYPKIIIEKEFAGGYSGTRVFLVLPINARGASDVRMVTKVGPAAELRQEEDNYKRYIERSVPFTATQVKGYFKQGELAVLNYIFAGEESLGQTICLEDFYQAQPAENIGKTLETLLDKSLGKKLYGKTTPLIGFFRAEYERHLPGHEQLLKTLQAIFPNLRVLPNGWVKIPDVAAHYPDPLALYPVLLNKTLEGRRSLVHGDLHLRNVLVDETGKGWLIDFAKVTERHNLFDFIKLEVYIRLMALAKDYGAFSLDEYAQFEQSLNANTLEVPLTLPTHPKLAKTWQVIGQVRKIARKYMGPDPDFRNEYFPALLLYGLAMFKYYASNGPAPLQLIFLTTCSLALAMQENPTVGSGAESDGKPYFETAATQRVEVLHAPAAPDSTDPDSYTGSAPPLPGFLVGREADLTRLKAHLESGSNLTVIRGLPGVGKTTLLAALAHDADVLERFPDGVLYTSLGPNPNRAAKITAWTRSMGMTGSIKARDLEDASLQLTALLSQRRMLLIVDDVWDAEDFRLFRVGGATCHTLVTTREPDVAHELTEDEHIYVLQVLAEDAQSLEILKRSAPGVVKKHPAQSLELARELQGLPLALRVAGHLLNKEDGYGFDVRDLLSELRRGGKLLEAEAPLDRSEAGERPTVSAILQKSIDRLSLEMRDHFIQLGVFARNPAIFQLEALRAVWELDKPQPVIRELVDRGLLDALPGQAGYQMHGLFYDILQPLLSGSLAQQARDRHFNFFGGVSRRYETVEPNQWSNLMADFEAIYPELKQALANFQREQGKPDENGLRQSLQMIDTLHKYWKLWKQVDDEQIALLDRAFSYATLLRDPLQQADFAERLGRAKAQLGQWGDGLSALRQCEIALGDEKSQDALAIRALMHIHRASIYYAIGEIKTAEKECKRGLKALGKKKNPLRVYAEGQNILGAIALANGKLSDAAAAFAESVAAWQQVGDEFETFRVQDNLHSARYYLGHIGETRREDEKSLEYWKKFPHSTGYVYALSHLGLAYYIDRRYEDSVRLHLEAIEKSNAIPDPRLKAETRANLAWPYIVLGRYDEAEALLKESLEIQRESGNEEYALDAQRCLAEIEIGRGNLARAIEIARQVAKQAHEYEDVLEEGAALRVLGQALYLNHETEQAKINFEKSFSLLSAAEYHYESLLTLQEQVKMHESMDDWEKAQLLTGNMEKMTMKMGLANTP